MHCCHISLPSSTIYHITKIMCTYKELQFKHIKYLALKADKITGIIFHLYKINLLIDNTGQKDYNKQRICYDIIFVMLYSLKPSKYGLFYIYNFFNPFHVFPHFYNVFYTFQVCGCNADTSFQSEIFEKSFTFTPGYICPVIPSTSPILSSNLWCSRLVVLIYPLVVSILLCPSTSASFAISFPDA